jgi:hypothetical protein
MRSKYILAFVALMALIALVAVISAAPAGAHDSWRHLFGSATEKGSGVGKSEDRDVGSFKRIDLATAVDLNITVGKPQKVTVTIDDNLLDNIRTRVHNGTLEITSRSSYSTDESGRIDVQIETLDGVTLSGSGTVKVFNLNGDKFEYVLSGSGDLVAEGRVKQLNVSLDGSGDVDTRKLDADDVSVEINGSGSARVLAHSSLDGVVNGSGDIEYTGDPEHVSRQVNGSGSITRES